MEAIVQRQPRVPANGNDDGFVFDDKTEDFASAGPVGRSLIELRFFHLATVFWLMR